MSLPLSQYYHIIFTIPTVLLWKFPDPHGNYRGYRGIPHYRVILYFPCSILWPVLRNLLTSVLNIAQIPLPLGSSRLDMTRLDTFDVSSLCILPVLSLSNSTAWHAWHDELDLFDTHDTTSSTRLACNIVHCIICIKLWYVSYSNT